jgi:hypothetical protein
MLNYFKNLLIGILIKISIAMSKLENQLFKNSDEALNSGDGSEINNIKSDLLKSLYNGEYNQEYVNKFYRILKKSDNLILNSNRLELLEKTKRHGMDTGNEDIIRFLNSNMEYKNIRIEDKIDKSDNFEIEKIITNKIEIINIEDAINGHKAKFITTLKSKTIDRNIKIEEITDYLHIKKINDNEKLLEFYLNNTHNIDEIFNELINIDNIYFKDIYGDRLEYKIVEYINKNSFNSYNILKFLAHEV